MSKVTEDYIVAIDLGSSFVRTIVAHLISGETPRIIGVGVSESVGMRRGVVTDIEEVTNSIKNSVKRAEQSSGVQIESAFVSVGGTHIECVPTKGVVAVGKADGEVEEGDVERVVEAAQTINILPNKEILHMIPQRFRLDDQEEIKDPVGMSGVRLEVEGILVLGLTPHLKNITRCINNNEIEVEGFVIAPLAAAKATLNRRQKELGVVMIDIGGGTTSVVIYEERNLVHLAVLPVGAGYITNDVAIGLRMSIDVAEKIKINYGSVLPNEIDETEQINLADVNNEEEGYVSRKHVAEIIEARSEEIFDMVEKELKKINRSALLPAGAVITGGGACMQGLVDLSKDILKLPAQTSFPVELSGLVDKVDNPAFSVSIGMILWISEEIEEEPVDSGGIFKKFSGSGKGISSKISNAGESVNFAKKWLKKFLP